jgi:hypothetical protein
VHSRKDAEELLRLVASDDPEEAHEEEKERQREKNRLVRTRENELPVEAIKKKIGKLTDDEQLLDLFEHSPDVVHTPAEFGALMAAETEKWAKVVKFSRVKAE